MSKPQRPRIPSNNRLLATLTDEEYNRILPDLEPVDLLQGSILYEQKETILYVYFPNKAAVSLLSITADDETTEVGLVGYEGMVGISVALGVDRSLYRAMVQIPGKGARMQASLFKNELKRNETLFRLILRYIHALHFQAVQQSACNRFHKVKPRLCHWLLETHDRIQSDTLPYTQDFLTQMLGTSRAHINEAVGDIEKDSFISHSRGQITILNRPGLESSTCECYQIVKDEFDEFLVV